MVFETSIPLQATLGESVYLSCSGNDIFIETDGSFSSTLQLVCTEDGFQHNGQTITADNKIDGCHTSK